MKAIQNLFKSCVGSVGRLFIGLLLVLLLQVPGSSCAADNSESVVQGNDALTYMMELDALKLNGTVVKVREWNPKDDSLLAGDYFEPIVVTISVRNRGGECFGDHDFYLKKGVKAGELGQGDILQFKINKNMCHPNKALIIMDLYVVQSKGGK